EDQSRFEAGLSAAMIRLLHDVHEGRVDPRAIGFRLNAPPDRHDFAAELRQAVADRRLREKLNELRPPLAQYWLLRGALARYRMLAVDDGDPIVPASVISVIRPGDRCGWVGGLAQRLVKLGDLSASDQALPDSARYVGPVVESVKKFQTRHGLEADGVLGKATIEALRVPLRWRVRQIELALERLRWLPHLGDQRLLVVNIPMFQLWAWDQIPPTGTPLFGIGVIVGRALDTQTPVFVATMRGVVFRPYWNVPRSILRHEILPALTRDRGYLERHDMEIVRGEGDSAPVVDLTADAIGGLRRGVLRVRQRPGPQNSLGLIKFEFPNEESVYMHGTPAQALFARPRRDFSHGCVRIEDPVRLAQWVLNDDVRWNRERIVAATTGWSSVRADVPQPIQVILFYTTAAVMPDDGSVRFAADIYGHDARLDRALERRVVGE
ncbi:MAG TPA: L,D-transpeptidase family protein, partial [Vicinamibacterales bacterium]